MKHIIIILLCAFAPEIFAQNFQFSTGYAVSGLVCSDGQVYTWGSNISEGKNVGILGNNSNKIKVLAPLKVSFPSGTKIKQIDAGSGNHFLAIDTDENIWGWGENSFGQIGQGAFIPEAINTPQRILKGEAGVSGANLTGVKYISGGNHCSFAVLANKRLVGWGENTYAQLGNNSKKNSNIPVYVLDSLKKPLENVIQVEVGDFTTFALVDPDGDGFGTVYSWGTGLSPFGAACMLGRSAKGGTNNGNESGIDSLAKPVILKNGTRLENIISISAGDVFCLALDKDNNVWAWGNNGWYGLCGQGTFENFSDPRKVLGGATGLPFLKAKSISGAQGFGMAITTDNKPVSWGNNSVQLLGPYYSGGFLGNGLTSSYSLTPVYIKFSSGTNDIHSNVETISDGDLCGFYSTTDKKLFTWGFNIFGQLGLGDTINRYYATSFDLASLSCSLNSEIITGDLFEKEENVLKLYPNPSSDIVSVGENITSIVVYNSIGAMVLRSNTSVINITSLPSGIYQVSAQKNNVTLTQKLVKQ